MNRFLFTVVFIFFIGFQASSQTFANNYTFGNQGFWDAGNAVFESGGDLFVIRTVRLDLEIDPRIVFSKLDDTGNILDENLIELNERCSVVSANRSSNLSEDILVAYTTYIDGERRNGILGYEFASNDSIWNFLIPQTNPIQIVRSAISTSDGGYLVLTAEKETSSDFERPYLRKLDAQRNIEWEMWYLDAQFQSGIFLSTSEITEGYIMVGFTGDVSGNQFIFWKTNLAGESQFIDVYGGQDYDWLTDGTGFSDGSFVVSGGFGVSGSQTNTEAYLAKHDPISGNPIWESYHLPIGASTAYYTSAKELISGEILACGTARFSGTSEDGQFGIISKFDGSGQQIWTRKIPYNLDLNASFRRLDVLDDDRIVLTGSLLDPFNLDTRSTLVVVTDEYGCLDGSCPNLEIDESISKEELVKVYPNPSTGEFWLELDPKLKSVNLTLHSPKGQIVMEKRFNSIENSSVLVSELHDMPKGVYFIAVSSGSGELITALRIVRQ